MIMRPEDFEAFPKLARWNREVVVTEKIDGCNVQVFVDFSGDVYAAQRNGPITPASDPYNFGKWVEAHASELRGLGQGRHFGEWWGSGVRNGGYGLTNGEKRFSLFNVSRWTETRPACCHVVPVLWRGMMADLRVDEILAALKATGSQASPGFMKPEGVVVFHLDGQVGFKKTFDDAAKSKAAP